MVGVVIDGEDVMQDALINAVEARPQPAHPKPAGLWLFRIVHNAARIFYVAAIDASR